MKRPTYKTVQFVAGLTVNWTKTPDQRPSLLDRDRVSCSSKTDVSNAVLFRLTCDSVSRNTVHCPVSMFCRPIVAVVLQPCPNNQIIVSQSQYVRQLMKATIAITKS